jgi:uncharacterized membrane protein
MDKKPGDKPEEVRPSLMWAVIPAVIAIVAFLLPPDGTSRASFGQFLGRFHPILVHLPIGLLVIVPLMEILGASQRFRALREAAGFVLLIAAIASVLAAADGWLLARFGGYGGKGVIHHMWGGIALSFVMLVAAATRHELSNRRWALGWFYPIVLVAALGLMAWTGHEGGKLSHGEGFLTKYMPSAIRGWFGVAPAPVAPPVDVLAVPKDHSPYTVLVVPLFERSCVSCHGPEKHKGGLRMDSYAFILKGGEDGSIVTPGDPKKSDLYRRITLPKDDDEFMPSDGHKVLSSSEVETIRQWIAWGAPGPTP